MPIAARLKIKGPINLLEVGISQAYIDHELKIADVLTTLKTHKAKSSHMDY